MKTTSSITKAMLALIFMLFISESFAAGIGISLGSGSEEWDGERCDTAFFGTCSDVDADRDISNFGFVVDTTIARNKVFNYRFSLLTEDNEASGNNYDVNMSGIAMTHDFGFGIVRNRVMRFWMGPQLKAAFYDDISAGSSNVDLDGDVWGYAFGPVVGFNFHLPQVVSFSVTAGYHILSEYFGTYDVTVNGFYSREEDVDVESTGSFINASILFRFNDRY